MTPRLRAALGRAAVCAALGSAWLAVAGASAATVLLRPGGSLQQALREAADGDTIEIATGDYFGQVAVIEHKHLTLRGTGGRPVLHAAGRDAEGKAILVVRDGDIVIENIEFRGARVPDHNGAGIRFERGRLHVRRCVFVDNENGILTANYGDAELSVEDSEFAQAPVSERLPHLLYVGRIARFTLTGSHLHGGRGAHLVKSRARDNRIFYNRLVDGLGGRASYELEFPNGGVAFVVGNVIGQSAATTNPVLLSFGAEGSDEREQALFMAHNTLVSEGLRPGIFVRVHEAKLPRPVEMRFVNNLSVGIGAGELGLANVAQGNFTGPLSLIDDVAAGRYGLSRDSWLRGRGVDAGSARGVSLQPTAEFTPPMGTRALPSSTRLSPGAIQD